MFGGHIGADLDFLAKFPIFISLDVEEVFVVVTNDGVPVDLLASPLIFGEQFFVSAADADVSLLDNFVIESTDFLQRDTFFVRTVLDNFV